MRTSGEEMLPTARSPTILIPTHLNPGPTLRAINQFRDFSAMSDLSLDFRALEFARPFGILLIAEALRDLIQRRSVFGLAHHTVGVHDCQHRPAISYLAHIGFFAHIGTNVGKQPGQAPGSQAYVPITVMSRGDLSNEEVLQKAIDRKAGALAAMIFQDVSQRDMLQYCLREIIRNVFEHAQVDSCVLMAQRYMGEEVEIAIADRGIGIAASLSEMHPVSVPGQALKLAVQPGVSRAGQSDTDDPWGNSGFGLYILSRLGMQNGTFRLVSSGMSLEISRGTQALAGASLPGTVVGLRVNTKEAEYFPNLLEQLVRTGEAASGLGTGAGRRMSMSRLLSRHSEP